VEVRTGWQPLDHHADAFSMGPSESIPSRIINREHGNESENEGEPLRLAKPGLKWNRYKRKRDAVGKENPPPRSEEPTRTGKTVNPTNSTTHPQFGYPIPCYSLDVDRDNNRFRPELIGLVSYPIPKS
jgi:hypothetical protein